MNRYIRTTDREINLHKHEHYNQTLIIQNNLYINQTNRPKQIRRLSQSQCMVCGSLRRTSSSSSFCSNTCLLKHQRLKHQEFKLKQQSIDEAIEEAKPKKWWQI